MEKKLIKSINHETWLCCPNCGKKLFKISENTKLFELPVYCRSCKVENYILELKGDKIKFK